MDEAAPTTRRCKRHQLAAGPDGHCALCRSEQAAFEQVVAKSKHRWARHIAVTLVAVAAGLATFATLLAIFDTRDPDAQGTDAGTD